MKTINYPLGKCQVEITHPSGVKRFEFKGHGIAIQHERIRTGFFRSHHAGWGEPKLCQESHGRERAEKWIKEIRADGGFMLENEWLDYAKISSIKIIEDEPEAMISVELRQFSDCDY